VYILTLTYLHEIVTILNIPQESSLAGLDPFAGWIWPAGQTLGTGLGDRVTKKLIAILYAEKQFKLTYKK